MERPALPGPRRSNRGERNPSQSGGRPRMRLTDASVTGAREGLGRGGGYPEDAVKSWPRARRRTGSGISSQRSEALHQRLHQEECFQHLKEFQGEETEEDVVMEQILQGEEMI